MRCVLYLRMSTDDQDHSIADQRASLREYAAKAGYSIISEYVDEGISGDATEKRMAFQRMIADCSSKIFDTVLAWDQDRFGRFDPLEAGFWIKPMRDAGVVLETIAQGRVDWNDFAGRIVWSVTQEAKHAFLRDLAGNCLRGNIARAKAGISTGRIPFGYTRSAEGRYELGDPEAAATVREIFDLRLQGLGFWMIAVKLNERCRPAPSGKWSKEAVRTVVLREVYTGTLTFGKMHSGKYKSMTNGAVGPAKRGVNAAPIRIENAHPAIVPLKQWQEAQKMFAKPHARIGSEGGALAGLLYCSLCDKPMYAMSVPRTRGKVIAKATYRCSTYHTGRGCGHCAIQQEVIHQQVSERIKLGIRGDCETEAQLAERIRIHLAKQPCIDPAPLKKQLAELNRAITEASNRMLTISKRLLPDLEVRLLQMHDQRDALSHQIAAMVAQPLQNPVEVAEELWLASRLLEEQMAGDARMGLKVMFQKIIANFEPAGENRRGRIFRFTGFKLIDRVSSKEWPSSCGSTPFLTTPLAIRKAIQGQAALRKGRS